MSFGAQSEAVETWALLSGLAGYTLLLALTAYLLVRFAGVWDDVRTVLLLVVLMFLATSVTFDDVLAISPERGSACFLLGLALAVLVSEGLLHGIRLALPALFRLPYYLILALFFLYPPALTPVLNQPGSETLLWGLFGFSTVAGLIFLTLLPAIRRGPEYVRDNGSPWPWPLYPWTLFGMLACAVPGRAVLLCWSMHLVGIPDLEQIIFGPYFLVPFGLALAVLLLEMGLVTRSRRVLWTALAVPMGLTMLALIGHRSEQLYEEFLALFRERLGGTPVFLTLLASAAFYFYAWLRRVSLATEALTATLAVLAIVGADTLRMGEWSPARPEPLVAAAALQLGLGIWRRESWRCLIGGVAAVAALTLSGSVKPGAFREALAFHQALLVVLVVGAAFDDVLARELRVVGAGAVLLACLRTIFGRIDVSAGFPHWTIEVYPLAMAALLAGYGFFLRNRFVLGIAGAIPVCWLTAAGWHIYRLLRHLIIGLDYLAVFILAILVSLGKSGILMRWLATLRRKLPQPSE